MKKTLLLIGSSVLVFGCIQLGTSADRNPAGHSKKIRRLDPRIEKANRALARVIPPLADKLTETPTLDLSLPTHIFPRQYTSEELNACTESICGPAIHNWGAWDLSSRSGEDLEPARRWNKDFGPLLLKLAHEHKETEIAKTKQTILTLQRPEKLSANHPARPLFIALKIMTDVFSKGPPGDLLTSGAGGIVLNEENWTKMLATFPAEQQPAYDAVIRRFLMPFYQKYFNKDPLLNPLTARLQKKYPGLSLKKASRTDSSTLLKSRDHMRAMLGPILSSFFFDTYNWGPIERAFQGEDLSKSDSDMYIEAAETLEIYSVIYADDFLPLMALYPLEIGNALTKMRTDKFFETELQHLQQLNPSTTADEISKVCIEKIRGSKALSASKLRLKRMEGAIAKVKEAAKKVVTPLVQPEQLAAIHKDIDEIQFTPASTYDERYESLKYAFQKAQRSLDQTKKLVNRSNDKNTNEMVQYIAYGKSDEFQSNSDKSETEKAKDERDERLDDLKEIVRACESLPADTISDFAMSFSGKISVSWFSANYPQIGVGIVAHEIGHVLSASLRKQIWAGLPQPKFTASRACVSNRNPFNVVTSSAENFRDTVWIEEDWADHFSSLVMKQLVVDRTFPFEPRNKGCALVKDWGVSYYEKDLAPSVGDTHSSGILRLLLIANDLGKVTPQCQPMLEYAKESGRPLDCR